MGPETNRVATTLARSLGDPKVAGFIPTEALIPYILNLHSLEGSGISGIIKQACYMMHAGSTSVVLHIWLD